jgi:hypothetical protein
VERERHSSRVAEVERVNIDAEIEVECLADESMKLRRELWKFEADWTNRQYGILSSAHATRLMFSMAGRLLRKVDDTIDRALDLDSRTDWWDNLDCDAEPVREARETLATAVALFDDFD